MSVDFHDNLEHEFVVFVAEKGFKGSRVPAFNGPEVDLISRFKIPGIDSAFLLPLIELSLPAPILYSFFRIRLDFAFDPFVQGLVLDLYG